MHVCAPMPAVKGVEGISKQKRDDPPVAILEGMG